MRARSRDTDVALEALATRISRWRRTRPSSRSAMPEELWAAAVAECGRFTVHSVAQHLGLGYDRLRRRCVEAQVQRAVAPQDGVADSPTVQFVEVGRAVGATLQERERPHEVELVRPDGARMIVRSPVAQDLRDLVGAFLGSGA